MKVKILGSGECYGDKGYVITNVVYNINGHNHHADTHLRLDALKPGSEVDTTEFTNMIEIPVGAYCPLVPAEVTIASEALSVNTYIKRANLVGNDFQTVGNDITNLVLNEVAICEKLKSYPHPNIAQYFGCEVQDGRVSGICYKRYEVNLQYKINPRCNNKKNFVADRQLLGRDPTEVLNEVEKGIRHLHSLGLRSQRYQSGKYHVRF